MIIRCPLCSRLLQIIDHSYNTKQCRCVYSNKHFYINYTDGKEYFCNFNINDWNYQFYYQSYQIFLQQIGYHPGKIMRQIPWFKPDFNDMDKLLNKLKLYTVLL
jgi:hypothetical protein